MDKKEQNRLDQKRRRAWIDEMVHNAGFKSLAAMLTAWRQGKIKIVRIDEKEQK